MAQIINNNGILLPIVKLGGGKYLIGVESKIAVIKGTTCVVRVGGGFENMQAYILRVQEDQLAKLDKMMKEQEKTLKQIVNDLVRKFKGDSSGNDQFQKNMSKGGISDALKLEASPPNPRKSTYNRK